MFARRVRPCHGGRVSGPWCVESLSTPEHANQTGCKVVATARRPEALVELSQMGMNTVVLDINDEKSLQDAKVQVEALTDGKLDILVNNAWVAPVHTCTSLTFKVVQHTPCP